MLLKNASVYRNSTRSFERADIKISDGIIADIGNFPDEKGIDLEGMAVLPGLIDVHTHGRAGFDFIGASNENMSVMARDYARHGVTTVMPTLASAPFDEMLRCTAKINAFRAGDGEADFCGVHFEGRYLNPKKKGAHAENLLTALDPRELENPEFGACRCLQISAAFELDTDGAFAKKAKEIGATLSLGHTDADYAQARQAEKNGVTAYTHLFNAMPPLHHRDGGAVCAALTGECFGELICDGIHIAPQMIKLAYSMLGFKRAVLVSDSMEATGCPDGEYSIAGNPAVVKNGIATTPEGALAGSTLTLDGAVNNLIDFCGIPLTDAILCATENPARDIGVFDSRGSVDIGKRADLIISADTNRLDIVNVMVNGRFTEGEE